MNAETKYKIIDKHSIQCVVFTNVNILCTCHEYLSLINNELNILIKYRTNIPIGKLSFKHMYIIEMLDIDKKFPFITNVIMFDVKSTKLIETNDTRLSNQLTEISNNIVVKNLLKNIKENINKITKKNRSYECKNLIKSIKPRDSKTRKKDDLDITEIKNELDKLSKQKSIKEDELNNIQKNQEKQEEKLSEFSDELNDEKRLARIQKNRKEEKRRIFMNDREIYPRIKRDLEVGKLKRVPELFEGKYSIFKIMEEKNELYIDNAYAIYLELFKTQQCNINISESIADIFDASNITRKEKENDTQKIKNYSAGLLDNDDNELGNVDDVIF